MILGPGERAGFADPGRFQPRIETHGLEEIERVSDASDLALIETHAGAGKTVQTRVPEQAKLPAAKTVEITAIEEIGLETQLLELG